MKVECNGSEVYDCECTDCRIKMAKVIAHVEGLDVNKFRLRDRLDEDGKNDNRGYWFTFSGNY